MSGTHTGGRAALETVKARYGLTPEGKSIMHVLAGAKGGRASRTGGFSGDPIRAAQAGAKGGIIGKKGYKYLRSTSRYDFYEDRQTHKVVAWDSQTKKKAT